MTQNRIWWGAQAVGIKPDGDTGDYTVVHGAQEAGMSTSVDIKKIFELGQSQIYANIENLPSIEFTINKVFDGYPLIYHLATEGAGSSTFLGRANQRCTIAVPLFNDTVDSASGTPLAVVEMSGMYLNSWSAEFPVDGECKESVSFVGQNQVWGVGGTSSYGNAFTGTIIDNTDTPLSGVQQRQHVYFGTAGTTAQTTILPTQIPGISSSGTNNKTGQDFKAHVQKISISADANREAINELGRKAPYCRYMNLPVIVKTDIEIINLSGHLINFREEAENTQNETIRVVLTEGLNVYLGTKNRLTNVAQNGGDTGGGNSTLTFTYENANTLTITHPQAP